MKRLFAMLLAVLLCCMPLAGCGEEKKEAVILFTNDVHCGVSDFIGYAGLVAYQKELEAQGKATALVDSGDAIQGAPLGTLSEGDYIIDIMNKVGYDLAIPGNHEFDYGLDRFFELKEKAEYDYISANLFDLRTGKNVLDTYKILNVGGHKVGFVGVTTPKTTTSARPTYFQNENGEYVYSFSNGGDGQELYDAVQKAVDAARKAGAEYVVALTHLGIETDCAPWTSGDVILNTTGIDAVLDAHSHTTMEKETVLNKEGRSVLVCQTGTKLERIGYLSISADGKLDCGLVEGYEKKDEEIISYIDGIQAQLQEKLSEVVGKSEVELVAGTTEVWLVRAGETNMGNFCADAYRAVSGADVAVVNGGGVRANIAKGDVTYEDIILVHPYGNELCMVETTGQDILDALEMGVGELPVPAGGFLQVSGMTYEVDLSVPNSVKTDANGMFVEVDGEYRVKNVRIGGEPLDVNKTYTFACHNYIIKDGGGGKNMFQDDVLLMDGMLDNQVLMTYLKEHLNGVIGEAYADTEDRIIIHAAE